MNCEPRFTQLDLIRDRLSNGDFGAVPALLDSAEFCGAGLRDIVDDVLDFGKMSHASQAQIHALPNARQGKVDLLPITLEALRSSWIRRLQFLSATSPSPHDGHSTDSRSVTDFGLLFEYEDRSGLGDWWLSIDVAGFRRILNNLLINSLKYTAKGMVKISLATKLGLDYDGNPVPQITLRCADTGRGIPPSFLNKLFEPFTQVDSFSPGAGLGLHITKTIVDRMDGTITVDSRPGKGTTFTVTIPIEDLALRPPDTPPTMKETIVDRMDGTITVDSRPGKGTTFTVTIPIEDLAVRPPDTPPTMKEVPISDEQSPRPLLSPGPVPPTPTAGPEALDEPHLTILVVDDNIISRKILVTISKKLNATTHQAADGMDAIEVFRKVQPDVVWTDVSMPRMDGVTAAKEMRAIERERGWKASHIVAITGLGMSDEHIRREALTSSAALDGWLIKGQVNMKTMRESLVTLRHKLRTRASTI
uniref:histidine kinase n=1 Tax=Mycena chlorophos TaxID=658473 RepID=A0ABQ0M7C3_MYCCL|nr:sensor histidine kinase/response regulator [Mycena chlorophos]